MSQCDLMKGHSFKAAVVRQVMTKEVMKRPDESTVTETVYGLYCERCGKVETMQWAQNVVPTAEPAPQ